MPQQALYLKWRPLLFDEMVGQEHITRTLRNSIKTGRVRHAYLFSGPRGTGKTTSARLLAKAVNCTDPDPERRPCNECASCISMNEGRFLDLIEIDAATHTGVDDVRELRDKIAFTPGEGRYKVYIIDEVHRFSGSAFDALLKTLEEPPDHAIFVLATTEIDKVPATIKSRCLQFEFRRVSLNEVAERLAQIATSEGLKFEPEAMELIARYGTGSVRDSISLLDQIVADPDEEISLALVQRILGAASIQAVRDLVDAMVAQETSRGLHIINQAIDSGSDPRQFGQQIVEHLRAVLLTQTASAELVEASEEERRLYEQQARRLTRAELVRALRLFNDAVNNYASGWQPQLGLELAFIESVQTPELDLMQPVTRQTTPAVPIPAEAPPDPILTGAPPLIPPAVVREKWVEAQRLIMPHSQNLASLMDYAQVMNVDGNLVILGVRNNLYLEKLNDAERIRWIERALLRIHDTQLRVKFVLSSGEAKFGTVENRSSDIDLDDPLIQEAQSLGGEILADEE